MPDRHRHQRTLACGMAACQFVRSLTIDEPVGGDLP
jgi:hypothetical protein